MDTNIYKILLDDMDHNKFNKDININKCIHINSLDANRSMYTNHHVPYELYFLYIVYQICIHMYIWIWWLKSPRLYAKTKNNDHS